MQQSLSTDYHNWVSKYTSDFITRQREGDGSRDEVHGEEGVGDKVL